MPGKSGFTRYALMDEKTFMPPGYTLEAYGSPIRGRVVRFVFEDPSMALLQ